MFLQTKPLVGTLPDLTHPQSQDAISSWLFNEGVGHQLADSYPAKNHGTINGATWVPGALKFDALSSQYVNVSNFHNMVQNDIVGTVSIWASFSDLSSVRILFSVQDSGDALSFLCFYWAPAPDNEIRAACYEAGTQKFNAGFIGAPVPGVNKRHNYIFVQNGVSIVLFVDGIGPYFFKGGPQQGAWFNTVNDLDSTTIGCRIGSGSPLQSMDGQISNILSSRYVLLTTEAKRLYFNLYAAFQKAFDPTIFGVLELNVIKDIVGGVGIIPFLR